MPFRFSVREHLSLGWFLLKWLLLAVPLGALVGAACALFLWSLDAVTSVRFSHPNLVYLLPFAGIGIGLLYASFGREVDAGNNLIIDEIHEPGGGVPLRMAPLILVGTLVTHLFGGSAGREGTAVQIGGSLASGLANLIPRVSRSDDRIFLMAGISAGFGGVFGTPVAGTIFALEIVVLGRMNYAAIVPCLIAGITANQTCLGLGISHTHYHIASHLIPASEGSPFSLFLLCKVVLAAALFGLTSVLFAELVHGMHYLFKQTCWPLARPAMGGLLVIALMFIAGDRDSLGLGVSSPDPRAVTIVSCFLPGGAHTWSWLWKVLFTAITLSSGFKGGEVTPLFFIGAALGNTLGGALGAPIDLFAALGFVAVFAGATNTPLACTVMAVELFGSENTVYFATACIIAYLFSGHAGIYLSQRIGTPKVESLETPAAETLRSAREVRPALVVTGWGSSNNHQVIREANSMSKRHRIVSHEIGQLRIYVPQGETRHGMSGLKAMFGRPLYRDLVNLAKAEGIMNAASHVTQYGYSNNGRTQSEGFEIPNPHLNICVELIDHRDRLEAFCRKHAALLVKYVVVYKHLEHWKLQDDNIDVTDATIEELEGDGAGG